jgi:type I restriction enzyme S subunit
MRISEMRDEWIETSLGEIAEVVGGGTPSTTIGEYWDGDIVWLTPTEITSQDGKVVSDSIRKITDLGFKNSGAQMLPIDSVILTSRASVGFVALAGRDLCTNQGFQSLIPRPSVLPKFLMFWIQQNRPEFESRSAGSTFKEISKSNVKSIKLQLPSLSEQKRIVDLVSSVDAYLEPLQHQLESAKKSRNAVLHELLTIGGEDWIETTLDGIAEYINGYPFKPADLGDVGLPVIRIKQLLDPNEPVDRTETDTPDRCLLRDGDIVFSWSGTLAVRIWNRGPAKLNQHLFRVVEKKNVYKGIIPLILDHAIEELEEKSHGTTMKHITKQTLLPHKVLLPPLPEQKRIVEIVNTIDEVISQTELTISKTQDLRSGLLSDLLSGEHEIPASYDKVIGAA